MTVEIQQPDANPDAAENPAKLEWPDERLAPLPPPNKSGLRGTLLKSGLFLGVMGGALLGRAGYKAIINDLSAPDTAIVIDHKRLAEIDFKDLIIHILKQRDPVPLDIEKQYSSTKRQLIKKWVEDDTIFKKNYTPKGLAEKIRADVLNEKKKLPVMVMEQAPYEPTEQYEAKARSAFITSVDMFCREIDKQLAFRIDHPDNKKYREEAQAIRDNLGLKLEQKLFALAKKQAVVSAKLDSYFEGGLTTQNQIYHPLSAEQKVAEVEREFKHLAAVAKESPLEVYAYLRDLASELKEPGNPLGFVRREDSDAQRTAQNKAMRDSINADSDKIAQLRVQAKAVHEEVETALQPFWIALQPEGLAYYLNPPAVRMPKPTPWMGANAR